ncbi:hypothetical protein PGH12_17035 [Chryseobacterium wangxinyae]|uniref:hypothetical protein n=1 Tax=Chryseobacterium sp. CY350 TaxID=2997336 RepID=UPI00226E1AF2|nr:hypothetical protein [Chryseobacterium sp. CY350]MCY0978064.1 hypothetical protein [Chryseobacterium sp. CY350]WBZ95151.1 hypothetical protein PGH12_17035 [Chryseobacterium sp. CY350]
MTVHFILHGETFQSIADQINLENPLYIKEFHNQHCAREDFIYEDLVPRKKLLLPDVFTVHRLNAKNDAPFKDPDRNPKISFNPDFSVYNYKVFITESSVDSLGNSKETSFSYQFSLELIQTEFDVHTFHLSKYNFSTINDTKMGNLAVKCMQAVEPVEILTNLKGEIISVNLLPEIIDKFHKIKENLLDLFPDKYAKIYIDEFEYVVRNQNLFNKKMKQDWLIKTFFSAIRGDFKNGKSYLKIFLENKDSVVEIEQSGILIRENDEVILTQSTQSENKDIDFSANYIVSNQNGMIKSMDVKNSYSQYDILYTTQIKLEKV